MVGGEDNTYGRMAMVRHESGGVKIGVKIQVMWGSVRTMEGKAKVE